MTTASAFRAGASAEKNYRGISHSRTNGGETLGHELMHSIHAASHAFHSDASSHAHTLGNHSGDPSALPTRATITSPYRAARTIPTSSATEGSRSVVLALRGLQDKIQHLENERNHYKNAYEQGLTLHDAKITSLRVAHEEERQRLLGELETQSGIARKAMADRSALTAELEEERLNSSRALSHLEHLVQGQKQRLERSDEERERDGTALVDAQECIHQLRLQLSDLEQQRDAAESTVQQLSKSLKQVVSLNTNLVERVAQLHLAASMAVSDHSIEDGTNPARTSSGGHAPRYTSQTISSLNRSRDLSPLIGRTNPISYSAHGKRAQEFPGTVTAGGTSLNVQQLMNELEMEYQELLTHLKEAAGSITTGALHGKEDGVRNAHHTHDTDTSQGSNPTAVVSQLLGVLERKADQIACLRRCGAVTHSTSQAMGPAQNRPGSTTTHHNTSNMRSMSSPVRPYRGANNPQPTPGISQRTASPNSNAFSRGTPTTHRASDKRPLQTLQELRSLVQNHAAY